MDRNLQATYTMLFHPIINCSPLLYPEIDGQLAELEKSIPILDCSVLIEGYVKKKCFKSKKFCLENRVMYYKSLYPKLRKQIFIKLGTQNSENFKTMFPKLFKTTKIFVNKTPKPLINFSMKSPFLPKVYFQIKGNVKRYKITV